MAKEFSRWAALNQVLAAIDPKDHRQLCDAMATVYDTIAETFEPILQDYEGFSEDVLADRNGMRAGQTAGGHIVVAEHSDERTTLLDASRLLRALEQVVLETGHYIESDRGEDLEDLWRTADARNYVVPRVTPLAPMDGKPFLRRALLHHRIIPTSIGGFKVRLHRTGLVTDARGAEESRKGNIRNYGAALFPGLEAKLTTPDSSSFTVAHLEGFDAKARIDDHLRQARADGCCAVIWGELTMPADSVSVVRDYLADTAVDGHPIFRYMVAGSWHRDVEGKMRNVASVLDGSGELLFEVLKWAKFKIGRRTEAIEPGDEVHVLICEDELMVVAVCRDFLQATTDVPYRRLNVDVAIVPSMIASIEEEATLRGHAATADSMRVRFGTRTLVVAQPAKPGAEGSAVGQVMAFPSKPLEEGVKPVGGAWLLCPLELL